MKKLIFAIILIGITGCSNRIKDFDTCVASLGGHTDSNCEFCAFLNDGVDYEIRQTNKYFDTHGFIKYSVILSYEGAEYAIDALTQKEFNLIIKAIQ